MLLPEIQPFDHTTFRRTWPQLEKKLYTYPLGERVHAQHIEQAYAAQVDFIARLLGLTELKLTEINAILKDEDTGNLLAHRLLERLGINDESLANLPLHLLVEAEVVETSSIPRPHIDIRGYSFSVKHKESVCPVAVINHCKEEGPELEINGEIVKLAETDWPKLMYGLVGLVEDIQLLPIPIQTDASRVQELIYEWQKSGQLVEEDFPTERLNESKAAKGRKFTAVNPRDPIHDHENPELLMLKPGSQARVQFLVDNKRKTVTYRNIGNENQWVEIKPHTAHVIVLINGPLKIYTTKGNKEDPHYPSFAAYLGRQQ